MRNLYLLVPPAMRLWMNEQDSYVPAQPLGQTMMGITLGIVEASNDPALPVGTHVNGMGGCQEWFTAPAAQLMPLAPHPDVPLAAYRSVLDVQGLTAWAGLHEVCRPQPGQTLVVTAAAGSVGSLVCQLGAQTGPERRRHRRRRRQVPLAARGLRHRGHHRLQGRGRRRAAGRAVPERHR